MALTTQQVIKVAQQFAILNMIGQSGGGNQIGGSAGLGGVSHADFKTCVTAIDANLDKTLTTATGESSGTTKVVDYAHNGNASSMSSLSVTQKNLLLALVCMARAGLI